jgi:hypothetical protein
VVDKWDYLCENLEKLMKKQKIKCDFFETI